MQTSLNNNNDSNNNKTQKSTFTDSNNFFTDRTSFKNKELIIHKDKINTIKKKEKKYIKKVTFVTAITVELSINIKKLLCKHTETLLSAYLNSNIKMSTTILSLMKKRKKALIKKLQKKKS